MLVTSINTVSGILNLIFITNSNFTNLLLTKSSLLIEIYFSDQLMMLFFCFNYINILVVSTNMVSNMFYRFLQI
jgi:hypothetical protein